jgi:hypothetical protein
MLAYAKLTAHWMKTRESVYVNFSVTPSIS